MKVRIIGDEIYVGSDRIATINPNFTNHIILDSFRADFNNRFRDGMRIIR